MFEITLFHDVHTCSQNVREQDHRQAAPWVVGHLVKRKFAANFTKYLPNNTKQGCVKLFWGRNEL